MQNENYIYNGLSGSEVQKLTSEGLVNGEHNVKTRSIGRIVSGNICTLFNFINFVLAIFVAFTGSYKNMLFMGVIICNIAIGIFQEIRAKKTIDRLSLLSAPRAKIVRDGEVCEISMKDIVLGDLCILERGDQICADCEVVSGSCEVDESLLTGESDPVLKGTGDELLSGSFLVSGGVRAKVVHIGEENYAIKIVKEAKAYKKPASEMMKAINTIIRLVSICILPIAGILFYKQCFLVGQDTDTAIVSTVAALIAMIPEGLVLLTSAVLAVSVVRLSLERTLVQELYCIETLARVDVLCLDKTGTITEGRMKVRELVPMNGHTESEVRKLLSEMMGALNDHNPTSDALREAFSESNEFAVKETTAFSSEKKYSGVEFESEGKFLIGACEFLLDESFADVRSRALAYSEQGLRVLVLLKDGEKREPQSLILIEDVIREDAEETLDFFKKQGVELKVISGDSPVTVASVAKRAGFDHVEYIDLSTVQTEEEVASSAEKYNVFGRVTPAQKLILVKALKESGHTVGMTGDGVNDVLALREADCSIAMQSGSDAARNVSKLVLLDSNFKAMPKVVAEGRRAINNLERSAALFLEKTTYAFLLALIFVFIREAYPFQPIQLTLVSALTIGVPSFLLALEPNYDLVKGSFFKNVMKRALPGGVLIVINVMLAIYLGKVLSLSDLQVSTLSVIMVAAVSFTVLFRVCRPWNLYRAAMFALLLAGFVLAFLLFGDFFFFTALTKEMCILAAGQFLFTVLAVGALFKLSEYVFSDKRKDI